LQESPPDPIVSGSIVAVGDAVGNGIERGVDRGGGALVLLPKQTWQLPILSWWVGETP
jgi:hypothetical protein